MGKVLVDWIGRDILSWDLVLFGSEAPTFDDPSERPTTSKYNQLFTFL